MEIGLIESIRPTESSATLLKEKCMYVKLYTMKGCVNCQLAKDHLDREDIKYELINCEDHMDDAVTAIKAAGSDILPIIQYGENYIAGYDMSNMEKLVKLLRSSD